MADGSIFFDGWNGLGLNINRRKRIGISARDTSQTIAQNSFATPLTTWPSL